ncbi:DUF4871 domain-containing protein [Chengkuizengella axinellae]|uniref:DUF4871 domain-containing protein n=1 Tax=Chengkuizengella axinellae TaxID=3064388 RepID=A0ABT9IZG9_9BACL|nr:DUF4871 domain-containing protein [Chengkuizengella sp. 2205SS18-9]MDP5274698.1 DUF4871 domain-containing protein [Chengkuizengella sp. 2205SS18-9]
MKKRYLLLTYCTLILIVIFTGCSEEVNKGEQESPTFAIPVEFNDGIKGEYVLIGEEGKIGFQVGGGIGEEIEANPVIQGKGNKYMWYIWEQEDFKGTFKIVGTHENGEEHKILTKNAGTASEEQVWEYSFDRISSNNNFIQFPSSMEFPIAGLWKLEVFMEEKLFSEIFVFVESE